MTTWDRVANEMIRSIETGQQMRQVGPAGHWVVASHGRAWAVAKPATLARRWARWLLTVLLSLALVVAVLPARAQAAPAPHGGVGLYDGCGEFDHHRPTRWLYQAIRNPTKSWYNPDTQDAIIAYWAAKCARWLIVIFRDGQFRTHFWASWRYIIRQVARGAMQRVSGAAVAAAVRFRATIILLVQPCQGWIQYGRCMYVELN